MQSKVQYKKNSGFTLIELLVVISIIALLVSILMPSLQAAKDLAKQAVCMSNMKQFGNASLMYIGDNNEWLVPCFQEGQTNVTYYRYPGWFESVLRYLGGPDNIASGFASNYKMPGIYFCPSDTNLSEISGQIIYDDNHTDGFAVSNYGYNNRIGGNVWWAGEDYVMRRASTCPAPSETVIMGDCLALYWEVNSATWSFRFPQRHVGYDNIVFVDGHVDNFDPSVTSDSTWNPYFLLIGWN